STSGRWRANAIGFHLAAAVAFWRLVVFGSGEQAHEHFLCKLLQLFPPLVSGCQLILQLLQASLLRRDLRTGLLVKLRLRHFAVQRRDLSFVLLDFFWQALQLLALFERQFSFGLASRL